jgi:hypothetical protein
MQTDLLHGIRKMGSHHGQVLESAGKAAILRGVINRSTSIGGYLGQGDDGCGRSFALDHAGALKNLLGVLVLAEEEASRHTADADAEEVMQGTQVLHRELEHELVDESVEEHRRGGHQDNIINVQQEVCHVGAPP